MKVDRTNVLGVGVSALNLNLAVEILSKAVDLGQKGYVSVTGVHGVMEAQDNPEFRQILNRSFLCTPDGMPLVWLSRLSGKKEVGRVYGPDLMLEFCQASVAKGYRHFLYGGANGTALELKARLEERFPGLQICGIYEPPFRPLTEPEMTSLCARMADSKAQIIWVGLSTPKQEMFMAANLSRLPANILIGVGAAFDFHAGRVKQAPRWIQRSGLEWFYRLCREPRRLWKRYFRNNPRFLFLIALQRLGLKKYSLDEQV